MTLVIERLSKSYRGGRVRALDDVSLTIAEGEVFGIIGPNGAGKTTLLGCLLGFLRPDAGSVTIGGASPDDLTVRKRTGYLPERLVMDRWMTGIEFLRYHHALARLPESERAQAVETALTRVGLDPAASARTIRRYSRGMLQRLGLAQALLGEPRWVFLDEPASGVDPAGVVLFRRLLLEVKARGATVVLNSHQLEQVERVCDRVAFVQGGRVQAIETMHAGATLARVVRVRFAAAPPPLEPAATRAGATLESAGERDARFGVGDDAAAARLVAALVQAGAQVAEVVPDESRLERLFLHPGAVPPSPPPAPGAGA
ncbi:MAG TPA: ABC transporter ATP-binding protein [Candidatus Eisenbacteria bacterium]|nr:ABC transporter ATP-binding protein [Candidatus Eisenbacteria bacterium]